MSNSGPLVDISAFFSRYRLPKLRYIDLRGCQISWDLLGSQTTALTTLYLAMDELSPIPTLSQLLSILSSNPLLQNLSLDCLDSYIIGGDAPTIRVQLQYLEYLGFLGDFRCVFVLLNRLEFPDRMKGI